MLLHDVLAAAKKNVPAKVAAARATILSYVSRVQNWSHGKSGGAAAPLSEVELRQLGLLFQQHWPQALLPDSSSSEDFAADIAAQLSALRVRNPLPGSRLGIAGSFVEVLKKAIAEYGERGASEFARVAVERLTAAGFLARGSDSLRKNMGRAAGLVEANAPFFLLVRALALCTGRKPEALYELPRSDKTTATVFGVRLRVGLVAEQASTNGGITQETSGSALSEFTTLGRGIWSRRWWEQEERQWNFSTEFAQRDDGFELEFALSDEHSSDGPPPSLSYGLPIHLAIEFARLLRTEWLGHSANRKTLASGARALEFTAAVHAGATPVQDWAETWLVQRAQEIGATPEAYFHARALDLRVLWKSQPLHLARRGSLQAEWYVVRGLVSHVYFSRNRVLANELKYYDDVILARPSYVGLAVEVATVSFHAGQWWRAIETATRARTIDPHQFTAWQIISHSYANLAHEALRGEKDDQINKPRGDLARRYYLRATQAARQAITANPQQEEGHVTFACMLALSTFNCLCFFDDWLCSSWEGQENELEQALASNGFATGGPQDARGLLRRAAMQNLLEARRVLDEALTFSATRAVPFFWRLILDALIAAADAHPNPPRHREGPDPGFREIGWLRGDGPETELLDDLKERIAIFDRAIQLDLYKPEVQFAYALLYCDWVGPQAVEPAIGHLKQALAVAEAVARHDSSRVMRCWGVLQPVAEFKAECTEGLARLERFRTEGGDAPRLLDLYLGNSFAAAAGRLLVGSHPARGHEGSAPTAP